MTHLADEKIDFFFEWLKKNISALTKSRELQQEMTKKVKALHRDIHWEVGPLSKSEMFFAFSPNLNEELLAITNLLASKAPKLKGWKFLAAKPKKIGKTGVSIFAQKEN